MTRFIIGDCATIGVTIGASECAVLSEDIQQITMQIDGSSMIIHPKLTEKYLGKDVNHNEVIRRVYFDRVIIAMDILTGGKPTEQPTPHTPHPTDSALSTSTHQYIFTLHGSCEQMLVW